MRTHGPPSAVLPRNTARRHVSKRFPVEESGLHAGRGRAGTQALVFLARRRWWEGGRPAPTRWCWVTGGGLSRAEGPRPSSTRGGGGSLLHNRDASSPRRERMFAEGSCRSGPSRTLGARARGLHVGCEGQEGHPVPGEGHLLPEHPSPVGGGGSSLPLSLRLRTACCP